MFIGPAGPGPVRGSSGNIGPGAARPLIGTIGEAGPAGGGTETSIVPPGAESTILGGGAPPIVMGPTLERPSAASMFGGICAKPLEGGRGGIGADVGAAIGRNGGRI